MVTDMGGFVASVFKRGIPFIHIPTTLLGMTDAAIGSKTAIDFAGAKNQVGTFAHPMGVFISTQFLQSLSDRDLFSAFGEIIKYALTSSATLWDVIANQPIDRSMDFDFIIGECAEIKNNVVQKDWHESADRKILNFGHTAGHALESLSLSRKKRRLLHGEAIALGIIIELFISTKILGFPTDKQREIEQYILDNFDLYPIDSKDFDALVGWMRMDKKNSQNGISFVLLKEIGEPVINQLVHEELIMAALKYYAEL
jgi:3-dehydroquinate synthase